MDRKQMAAQMRAALQMFVETLPDEKKTIIGTVFPAFKVGRAYALGEVFRYGTNGVGDPQLYQVLQEHTSMEQWKPDETPSLYKPIGVTAEGYAEWAQPVGAADAYNEGDVVSYEGTLYQSTIDGNVWNPAEYPAGWTVYTPEAEG